MFIKSILARNHKAIESNEIILSNLARINVICGKNNSGKSSILEALTQNGKWRLFLDIYDPKALELYLNANARHFSSVPREYFIASFKKFCANCQTTGATFFSGEERELTKSLTTWTNQFGSLGQYGRDRFNDEIFAFENAISFLPVSQYKPILIPPKRKLESKPSIQLSQQIQPEGIGIINRLFFLKNQDIETNEQEIYKTIYDAFIQITGCKFNVVPTTQNNLSLVFKVKDRWEDAESCGLGLSDILIILHAIHDTDKDPILIEEPENHLHADFQRKLLLHIKSITNKQFVLSSHSSVLLDSSIVEKIYFVSNIDKVIVSDQTKKSEMIQSLGYSIADNLLSDLLILVEGPHDITVIKKIFEWIGIEGKYNIKYWPLGGDIMAELDLTTLSERKNVYAIIDNDPKSSVVRTRFTRNCKAVGIPFLRLERYSIENYFTLDAIRMVFPDIPTKIRSLDPNIPVEVQIGFKKDETNKNGRKRNKSLKIKNHNIIEKMKLDDFKNTDLLRFLLKIKDFLEH